MHFVSALMLSTGWLLYYLYRALNTTMKLFYHVLVSVHVSLYSLPACLPACSYPHPPASPISPATPTISIQMSDMYVYKHMVFVISLMWESVCEWMCVCALVNCDSVCMHCVDDATVSGYSNNGNWTMWNSKPFYLCESFWLLYSVCV